MSCYCYTNIFRMEQPRKKQDDGKIQVMKKNDSSAVVNIRAGSLSDRQTTENQRLTHPVYQNVDHPVQRHNET